MLFFKRYFSNIFLTLFKCCVFFLKKQPFQRLCVKNVLRLCDFRGYLICFLESTFRITLVIDNCTVCFPLLNGTVLFILCFIWFTFQEFRLLFFLLMSVSIERSRVPRRLIPDFSSLLCSFSSLSVTSFSCGERVSTDRKENSIVDVMFPCHVGSCQIPTFFAGSIFGLRGAPVIVC